MSNQTCSRKNMINDHGVGHPSALTMEKGSAKQIWLYYYDSREDWSQHGVYLAESWDAFHFTTPVKTNLANDASIKYYQGAFGEWSEVFIATTVIGEAKGFAISKDAIHWVPQGSDISIGTAVDAHCAAPGPATIVGDEGGDLSALSVNTLSPGGFFGQGEQGPKLNCYNASEDRSRGST
ncbi:MAG: hypothetical protein ACREDT_10450 [Methylocella sp.]